MKTKREITGITVAGLIVIAVLLFMPFNSSAEVTFTSLAPMEHGLRLPEDVAVAPDGKAYAVDGSQGLVMIYNRGGEPAGNIWIAKPTSVAVNTDSLIYVGTNENLSVKILDSSHKIIGSLGSGAGEFKLPRNISIDKATGNVYVVDQIDQSIKVYTSSGTFLKKIDDYPNLPQDVTIMNNKIYVLDHPLIADPWGGTIRGAKVRVFDMDGNVLDAETFGSYGDQEGQFVRPAGITSDTTDGLLYISDSFHGVVMCFESDGNYLGAIQNSSDPMVTPMGIALGEDRRLLVASLNTKSIHVFGLEGYTEPEEIEVSPSSLTFTAEAGQSNPIDQNLTISNTGIETKTYNASANKDWIVLNTTSVTIDANGTGVIPIGVNASGLGVGIYNGQVTITDGIVIKNIPVTLEIIQPVVRPALSVTPGKLTFLYSVGGSPPASQTVNIELANDNGATTWTATADAGWISILPLTGQGTTTIVIVSVDTTDLEPGDYSGTITIEAPGADNSPATIGVTLTIKFGGMIEVTCNIEEASFSIAGPVNYEGDGLIWTAIEVPDGTYIISYNQVVGYKTPLSETKDISSGGAINFKGNYTSLAMDADIIVSCGSDYRQLSTVGVFNTNGIMASSFTPFAEKLYEGKRYTNGVNTAVGDIDGDGKEDIVVGIDLMRRNSSGVAAYRNDGIFIEGSEITLPKHKMGVNLAAADFDGNGKAEIVVGTGTYVKNPAYVSVFSYDSGLISDKVTRFKAFEEQGGVKVAAGDVDGDGIPELITAAGASPYASAVVRVLKIDTTGKSWTIVDTGIKFVAFPGRYGANVTTGDLNGDGTDEIIVASGPDPQGELNIIKAFNGDGTEFGLEIYDSSIGYGLNVASADVDSDGVAEIVVGPGTSTFNPSIVKIYKADGSLYNIFVAFDSGCYGAVVSVGDLGY